MGSVEDKTGDWPQLRSSGVVEHSISDCELCAILCFENVTYLLSRISLFSKIRKTLNSLKIHFDPTRNERVRQEETKAAVNRAKSALVRKWLLP